MTPSPILERFKMSDPMQLQMMLSNIQNQITALNNMVNQAQAAPIIQPQQPNFNQMISNMQPDIFSMVKTAVQSEMSKLGIGNKVAQSSPQQTAVAATQNIPQQTPQNNSPFSSMLPVIGAAYTQEQQEWISQPQNLMGIPGFLMTSGGKEVLNIALDEYQKFVTGNTQPT